MHKMHIPAKNSWSRGSKNFSLSLFAKRAVLGLFLLELFYTQVQAFRITSKNSTFAQGKSQGGMMHQQRFATASSLQIPKRRLLSSADEEKEELQGNNNKPNEKFDIEFNIDEGLTAPPPPSFQEDSALFVQSPAIPEGAAILLNTNANGVTPDVIQLVQEIAANHNNITVYVTSTKDEARTAAREMILSPPTVVIPLGGDGTLTTLLQLLHDAKAEAEERNPNQVYELPMFAYIAMGTGNALQTVVGCQAQPSQRKGPTYRTRFLEFLGFQSGKRRRLEATLEELFQWVDQQSPSSIEEEDDSCPHIDLVELPLLQVSSNTIHGKPVKAVSFFAGIGFDSLMLQDYEELQEWAASGRPNGFRRKVLGPRLSSVLGYCVTLVTRTLPKCFRFQSHKLTIRISTPCPESTAWVDHRRGDVVRRVSTNAKLSSQTDQDKSSPSTPFLLYEGPAGIVAASTAPFYGGGLRLFPFGRLTLDACQLRVGRISPWRGTLNLPGIFAGSYRDTRPSTFGCLDFCGRSFQVDILDPTNGYPLQHSGDSVGIVKSARLKVLEDPVQFVTLLPPRVIVDRGVVHSKR